MISISVQEQDFDTGEEYSQLQTGNTDIGGIAIFTGQVRDLADNPLKFMRLEHYPGMTEKLLQEIVDQAHQRWSLIGSTVIHRVGKLLPGDQIVCVGVASEHRADAFEAAQFLMDYLKTKATFWKKVSQNGEQHWIESKQSDSAAAERWSHDEN